MISNNIDGIDILLNNSYFHDKKNGFFLQVGAYDGVSDSITYSFQKQLQWKGLLIQPNCKLIDSIQKNRKEEDIILNVGIGDKTQILDYQYLPSRADSSGFNLTESQKQRLKKVGFNGVIEKRKLQVFSYSDLVKMFDIKKIDIAVIDVEGYQNKVLQNINQTNVKPTFVIAEYIHSNKQQLINIMNKNYSLIKQINKDLIFKRRYNILIITRCTRVDNLTKIKEDLDKKFKNTNFNYTWFVCVDNNKINQETFKKIQLIPEDNRNDIIVKLIKSSNLCKHGSDLLNISLFDEDVKNIDFVYTLDDDNIIHQNFLSIIEQNIQNDFDMLIINIEKFLGNIDNLPINCHGKVDTASMIFNYKTLISIGGYFPDIYGSSFHQDSLTCSKFIQLNKKIIYTQKEGAYYNKLK